MLKYLTALLLASAPAMAQETVIAPATHAEISAALRTCNAHMRVVPRIDAKTHAVLGQPDFLFEPGWEQCQQIKEAWEKANTDAAAAREQKHIDDVIKRLQR